MNNIIKLAFLYEMKDMNNSLNIENLETIKNKIVLKINESKYTREFLKDFIDMYDSEQLITIANLMKNEVKKRTVKELNNETY